MAGDTIQAAVRAYYRQQATPKKKATIPAEQMLAGLLQAFIAPATQAVATHSMSRMLNAEPAGPGLTAADLQSLKQKDPNYNKLDKPKAYLNYVFFDNQFKFVSDGSGVKQVDGEAGKLETLSSGKVVAKKDGYVYIYTSNESQQDVFFDNFGVLDITGPILEETHYYPDGLTMAGISTIAPLKIGNKFRYQGKELQNKEFADGSGLEWYDFEARYYDPQLGRWWSQDPAGQFSSPYLAMGDNWVSVTDPDGQFAWFIPIIIGAVMNTALHANHIHNVWQALGYGVVGGAAGALGAGLGAGIGAAIGGSGFGTGFAAAFSGTGSLAAAGITGATSSFLSGAAIGAGAGFGAGFVSGFGNTLVGGGSWGSALGQGLQEGLIGGGTGGLIGGIAGGIDAVRSRRRFFDGATVHDKVLVDQHIPLGTQSNQYSCACKSAELVDKSWGGNSTEAGYMNSPYFTPGQGTKDIPFWRDFAQQKGRFLQFINNRTNPQSYQQLTSALSLGKRVILSTYNHQVIASSIVERTITKLSGKVITRFILNASNPAVGRYTTINLKEIFNIFYIW